MNGHRQISFCPVLSTQSSHHITEISVSQPHVGHVPRLWLTCMTNFLEDACSTHRKSTSHQFHVSFSTITKFYESVEVYTSFIVNFTRISKILLGRKQGQFEHLGER